MAVLDAAPAGAGVRRDWLAVLRLPLAAAILLFSFGLQVHDLAAQSLWSDEVYSWALASRPLGAIPREVGPDHIAPYFMLLHEWLKLAGASEFGLRYLSLLFGVATIALFMAVARRLLGVGAALLVGAVTATNPFLLYYGQEVRMYTILLALSLLCVRLLLRLCRGKAPAWLWVAYALAVGAVLYTHYYALLLLPVLALGPVVLGAGARQLWRNALALVGGALLFAPWAIYRRDVFATFHPITSDTLTLTRLLTDFAVATHVGETVFEVRRVLATQPVTWVAIGLATALAMLGLIAGPGRWRARLFLLCLWLLPLAAVAALTLGRRDFAPRYAMVALAGYFPLVAAGLWRLSRWPGLMIPVLLALVGLNGSFVHSYFTDPLFQRQDFRAAIHDTLSRTTPDDAIVVSASYNELIWQYYAGNGVKVQPITLDDLASPARLDAVMRAATNAAPRTHLFLWQDYAEDPAHQVQRWLDQHEGRIAGHNWREITVYDYAPGQVFAALSPPTLIPSGADFFGQMRLLGYSERRLAGSSGLRLTLAWQRLAPVARNFHVFVHLVDAGGHNLAIADHRPGFDTVDLSAWDGRETLVDQYELAPSGGTPVRLELGLYDPASGVRLQPATLSLPYQPR